MSEGIYNTLRPGQTKQNIRTSGFANQQKDTSPFAYIIVGNNEESIINLNCQLLHLATYISEKFADSERAIGLVNFETEQLIDLRSPNKIQADRVLGSRQVYHLVKVISDGKNSSENENVNASNSSHKINEKVKFQPMFELTSEYETLLKQISSGKRKMSPQLHKKSKAVRA